MNQKGFATLEVIMMVVVIGILATIAVPRFTDVTTKANTAKIQSDLSTIDTAIQMYNMETGQWPTTDYENELKPYLNDFPKPPTGSAFIGKNNKYTIPDGAKYVVTADTDTTNPHRATLGNKTAGDFGLN